jgi:Cys-tRNA(Pro)/Cys-tRNA(Cys) deacylase
MSKRRRGPRLNTMRLLEANQIPYETVLFSPDIHSATGLAEATGRDPSTVYKTLVVLRQEDPRLGRSRPMLVMVAGDKRVDLQALAASIGEKKVHMASHSEAEELTGLQVGGISALALLNKGFDIYIDRAAQALEQVTISAGRRGVNLCLSVSDLVHLTDAQWVDATGEV